MAAVEPADVDFTDKEGPAASGSEAPKSTDLGQGMARGGGARVLMARVKETS
jgi:hypothetical protein